MSRHFLLVPMLVGGSFLMTLWILPGRETSGGVQIDAEKVDFGVLDAMAPALETIPITNRSSEPMKVRVASDCSCLSVEPLRAHLPPHSSIEISVRPNGPGAAERAGAWLEIDREVEITAQSETSRFRDSIPVSAKYFSPLQVEPSTLRQTLDIWSPEVWAISFTAIDGYRPTSVRTDAEFIARAQLKWHEDMLAGTITIVPAPPLEAGTAEGTVIVEVEHSSGETPTQEIRYPVEVIGALPYEITPSVIDLASRRAGSGAGQSAVIEAVSDKWPVRISDPESDHPRLIAEVDAEDPTRLHIRLRAQGSDASKTTGLGRGHIRFNVLASTPEGETAEFPDSVLALW